MKKLFTIIAVAIMMFISSTNSAMAQQNSNGTTFLDRLANALNDAANCSACCGQYNSQTGMYHFSGMNLTCESSCSVCHVTSVEKCIDKTVVHFVFIPTKNAHVDIVANTNIHDNDGNLTFPLRSTNGIYTDHSVNVSAGQHYEFTMTFPAVTLKCKSFDIVAHYPNHDLTFHVDGLPTTYRN